MNFNTWGRLYPRFEGVHHAAEVPDTAFAVRTRREFGHRKTVRFFSAWIGREVGRVLDGDHPCHDFFHLRCCLAARPGERLIDALEERAELCEYGAQPLCRCVTRLEVHLKTTSESFVLPLSLEVVCTSVIPCRKCRADFLIKLSKGTGKRCAFVLRRLSFTPLCPLFHRGKVLFFQVNLFDVHPTASLCAVKHLKLRVAPMIHHRRLAVLINNF